MRDGRRAVFTAVALIVGMMGFILVGGGLTLVVLSPELVDVTLEGLGGGDQRMGVMLFGVQLVAFFSVTGGLLVWTWRRRGRAEEDTELS